MYKNLSSSLSNEAKKTMPSYNSMPCVSRRQFLLAQVQQHICKCVLLRIHLEEMDNVDKAENSYSSEDTKDGDEYDKTRTS
jgi:hypothetical protein